MRKSSTKFQHKRQGGRAHNDTFGVTDLCSLTHSTVNDKHWQLYANALLYKLMIRAGV